MEYLFDSIDDYEESTGIKVNEAFRIGWDMARLKKPKSAKWKYG